MQIQDSFRGWCGNRKRPDEVATNPMDLWALRGTCACGKLSRRNTQTHPWTTMVLDMVVIAQVSDKKERVMHCTAYMCGQECDIGFTCHWTCCKGVALVENTSLPSIQNGADVTSPAFSCAPTLSRPRIPPLHSYPSAAVGAFHIHVHPFHPPRPRHTRKASIRLPSETVPYHTVHVRTDVPLLSASLDRIRQRDTKRGS